MSFSTTTCTNGNVVTHDWVIPNFSNCSAQYSSNFSFPSNDGIKFRFYINRSFTMMSRTYTVMFVELVSNNKNKIKLKHRMSVVNSAGKYCHTQETVVMFKRINSLEAPCHILLDDLNDSTNGWLINGTLTIRCELELVENDSLESNLEAKPGDFNAISQHYESLLESGKHSDVVLSVGEKEFHAHKLVLCARSPVFAAMFDHSETKEAQQGRVEIVDIQVEVFELFLRYIYSGKIDELDRFAPELLAVADLYQMDCLKSLCEHFLCSTLSIENVSQFLIHADLYRAEVLKCKCIDYITTNSEKVKLTEGWKAVATKADLLVLLFDKFSMKLNSVNK